MNTPRDYIYFGSYVLQLDPHPDFGVIWTPSGHINTSCLEDWVFDWKSTRPKNVPERMTEIGLALPLFEKLRHFANDAFEQDRVGWANCFRSPECALEYYCKFFEGRDDVVVLSLFSEHSEGNELAKYGYRDEPNIGNDGYVLNLREQRPEASVRYDRALGYDIIGIEIGGFLYTSYCHGNPVALFKGFDFAMNAFGLFEYSPDLDRMAEYARSTDSGFDWLNWTWVKVVQHSTKRQIGLFN